MKLKVIDHFDAAHRLLDYRGKCVNVHGHTWMVEVGVEVDVSQMSEVGFAIDFGDLKHIVKGVLEEYDHAILLSAHDTLSQQVKDSTRIIVLEGNPTAENLAIRILKDLRQELRERELSNISVVEVTVWESPKAGVTVYDEEVVE